MLSEAKHLRFSSCRCRNNESEILRSAQNDNSVSNAKSGFEPLTIRTCRWWLCCFLFSCCAEFRELRLPASVETTEGMRFRFGYRWETSTVAGTVLKMQFITLARSAL